MPHPGKLGCLFDLPALTICFSKKISQNLSLYGTMLKVGGNEK
jgi:hypothetical protein